MMEAHAERISDLKQFKTFAYNYQNGSVQLGFGRSLIDAETALRKQYKLHDEFQDDLVCYYAALCGAGFYVCLSERELDLNKFTYTLDKQFPKDAPLRLKKEADEEEPEAPEEVKEDEKEKEKGEEAKEGEVPKEGEEKPAENPEEPKPEEIQEEKPAEQAEEPKPEEV